MAKKDLERAVRFRLNHWCHLPGASGGPGDIVDLPRDVAEKLLERGGGTLVEETAEPDPQTDAPSVE